MKLAPEANGEHPQDPGPARSEAEILAEIRGDGTVAWFARNGVTLEQLWEFSDTLEAALAGETPGGES
jgi:hypothetical protein